MTEPVAHGWEAADGLLWTQYGDSGDWTVYHPRTSNAHLVTDAAHRLWSLVADGNPRNLDQLTAALASDTNQAAGPELRAAVEHMMVFMDRAGLIAPRAQR